MAVAAGLELFELVKLVPRMLRGAVLGGLAGGALGAATGVVLTLVTRLLGWGAGEGWTAWLLGALTVVVFSGGGTYLGGLRGCAKELARAIDELGWVDKLWSKVQPHVERYARAVRSGATHANARSAALRELKQSDGTAEVDGIAERAERYVASLIHGALVGGLLRSMVSEVDDASWEQVEVQGLRVAREAVGDMVARMFHGPAVIAMVLTVVAAAAPHALATLLTN